MDITTLRELRLSQRELLRLFNKVFRYDYVDLPLLETLTVLDPNYRDDDLYLALENGEVRSIVFLGLMRMRIPKDLEERFKGLAWLKAVGCVNNSAPHLDKLLEYVEDRLRCLGFTKVLVYGYSPWYLAPGPDVRYEEVVRVLRRRGYSLFTTSIDYLGEEAEGGGRTVDYLVDMEHFYVPNNVIEKRRMLEEQGYKFEDVHGPAVEEVANWVEKHFGFVWATETRLSGKRPWAGVVVARKLGGGIAGFAVYGATTVYRFGPIGTEAAERGKGVGTVLLYEALMRIRLSGVRIAVIPWTGHLFFYAGVPGVCGIRKYFIFQKKLS